jgi:predicted enzyme related to lactoylglutathione lyase
VSSKPKPSAVVFAKHIQKVARFYEEVVPMTVAHIDRDRIVLDTDGMQLVVHGIPKHIADQLFLTDPPQVRVGMPIKLCIPVSSIAEARLRAAKFGGKLDAKEDEWNAAGFVACDGHDPEGNVVQFRQLALTVAPGQFAT